MSEFSGLYFSPLLLGAFYAIRAFLRVADRPATYSRVRRDILSRRIEPRSRVRCTVMDWRHDKETMTLVVHPDSSSMILALKQEATAGDPDGSAQAPARRFVRAVERHRDIMEAAYVFSEPAPGHASFWIVEDDETLTSGDVPIEDLKLRLTSWTGAWGSGLATFNEILESYRLRQERARRASVAAGPRPV